MPSKEELRLFLYTFDRQTDAFTGDECIDALAGALSEWLELQQPFSKAIQENNDVADFHAHGVDVTEVEEKKMSAARLQVFEIMKDGLYRTVDQIQALGVNAPPQSITIYLRSFREKQYGGYTVNRMKLHGSRVFGYQVVAADAGKEQKAKCGMCEKEFKTGDLYSGYCQACVAFLPF